ncbi:hypothetical protein Tco_0778432 [Tanacetum coccineum]
MRISGHDHIIWGGLRQVAWVVPTNPDVFDGSALPLAQGNQDCIVNSDALGSYAVLPNLESEQTYCSKFKSWVVIVLLMNFQLCVMIRNSTFSLCIKQSPKPVFEGRICDEIFASSVLRPGLVALHYFSSTVEKAASCL